MSDYPSIREVLPHRPPMLLVDELLEADELHAIVRVSVSADSTFLVGGVVPGMVMIEYMAQCVAALVGYDDLRHGRPIQIGILMGVRQASFDVDHVAPGDELRVEARLEGASESAGQFTCTIERRGVRIASGRLSVYHGAPREAGLS